VKITLNSLNKLCQQHTILIENIYKLINPYITSNNKLTFSTYEEKINSLSHKVFHLIYIYIIIYNDNYKINTYI